MYTETWSHKYDEQTKTTGRPETFVSEQTGHVSTLVLWILTVYLSTQKSHTITSLNSSTSLAHIVTPCSWILTTIYWGSYSFNRLKSSHHFLTFFQDHYLVVDDYFWNLAALAPNDSFNRLKSSHHFLTFFQDHYLGVDDYVWNLAALAPNDSSGVLL